VSRLNSTAHCCTTLRSCWSTRSQLSSRHAPYLQEPSSATISCSEVWSRNRRITPLQSSCDADLTVLLRHFQGCLKHMCVFAAGVAALTRSLLLTLCPAWKD
jgi:hypothetical protein